MLANAVIRNLRPSISALLKSAASQQPLLATSTAVNSRRDLRTVGFRQRNEIFSAAQKLRMIQICKAATEAGEKVHSHSNHFKFERYFAVGMLQLFPAAYFIHGTAMDYALAVALTLHIHWGLSAVASDYARPFVVGETLSKVIINAVYIVTAIMFAGLLHFNYNDVGLTKAFEMVWDL